METPAAAAGVVEGNPKLGVAVCLCAGSALSVFRRQ
jgi:hypothetical protein